MCGLIGFLNLGSGSATVADLKKWAPQALYIDTLRGSDATGAAIVGKAGEFDIFKDAVPGPYAVQHPKFLALVEKLGTHNLFIGHNRKATVGGFDVTNAHPFLHNDVILSHNGTLHGLSRGTGAYGTSDSAELARTLGECASSAKYPEVLENLRGAYALAWANLGTKEVYFARNDQRPLWFGVTKDEKTLFWASESWMIAGLAARINIPMGAMTQLKAGVLLKFSLDLDKLPSKFKGHELKKYSNVIHYSDTRGYKSRKSTEIAGIAISSVVTFVPTSFRPYANPTARETCGRVEGFVVTSAGCCNAIMYNAKESELLDKLGTICVATVGSVSYKDGGRSVAVSDVRSFAMTRSHIPYNMGGTVALPAPEEKPQGELEIADREFFKREDELGAESFLYVSPSGSKILCAREALELVSEGCGMCATTIELSEFNELTWMKNSAGELLPICVSCQQDIDQ